MWEWGEELIERGRQQGLAQGHEQGLAQGHEQGLLRGRTEAVLRILSARRVQVGEEAQQRILACTDMATLDRWFDKSLNATRLSDVLEDLAS
jgi:flagellar biosynthesis/type III secretory pathway protein FliH